MYNTTSRDTGPEVTDIWNTTQETDMRIPVLSLRPYFVFQSGFQSYTINQQNPPLLNLNLI
jgi:hypothetical protein